MQIPLPRLDSGYGIEEEFFLVDPASRDLVAPPPAFLRHCRRRFGDRIGEEMSRAQLETATPVLHDAGQARDTVHGLRAGLAAIAGEHGIALVAAGTHPLANWQDQRHTDKPRYDRLVDDYQIVGRRNLVCGLHVHVGIPGGVDRVQLMNRLLPWLPLFLALSASSPFWNRRRTGLMSYRQAAYDEWPRAGIPDAFADEQEYAAFVALLARCGSLRDGSELWWALRPSARYPTLELRIADACTDAEDTLALAAAFRCLVRAHLRDPALGAARSALSRRIDDENRWRAKRHGSDAEFVDEASAAPVAVATLVRRMQALVGEDAHALDCTAELARLSTIVAAGTSAHAQLACYRAARARCRPRVAALRDVVDWLAATTVAVAGPATAQPSVEVLSA